MVIDNAKSANYIKLAAGVAAISVSPLAVKLVAFAPSVSAFYRSFYAACFFLLLAAGARLLRLGEGRSPAGSGWLAPSLLAGVFLGIDLIIWHKTILYLGAGPATFLGNSQILFVTLFAVLVLKEEVPKVFYLILAMVFAGLYLLIPLNVSVVSRPAGYALGLVVGLTYGGMLICLRYAKKYSGARYPELLSLAVVFLASSALIFFSNLAIEGVSIAVWDLKSHIIMAVTALLCQTLGWYMINASILELPAHEGSLILMLQPVLAVAWGCIFFLEPLAAVQITGIAIALAGIFWYQMIRKESCVQKEVECEEVL